VQTEQYIKAGKIASEVREMVRLKDWVGKTDFDM
jgi:methionyl aminopeptidase